MTAATAASRKKPAGKARGDAREKEGSSRSRKGGNRGGAKSEGKRSGKSTPEPSVDERIWLTVSAIPRGSIATYGDVAARAGLPGAARRVGAALRKLPRNSSVPWHRVVNAAGKSSLPPGARGQDRQRARLAEEGVLLESGGARVLARYRWH